MVAILKNRHDAISPPPIVWLRRYLAGWCKMTYRWLKICHNRNRK